MSLDRVEASRAALLVVDMQNAFCRPEGTLGISGVNIAPAHGIIAPVGRLIRAFKDAGLPVIWTVQTHVQPDRARAKKVLASHTAKRARVAALAGSWDAQLVDELSPLADDPTYVIQKHRFGAFYQTRLEQLLHMLGADALFVAGTTANACVDTTLREAYLRDLDVVAVTDAIAAVRPEWEEPAHQVWAQYLAVLATCDDVQTWLEHATAPRALGLHHLLLETTDLAQAEAFYLDLLGFEVRDRQTFRDGRPLVVTHQGFGITSGGTGTKGSLEHLCFRAQGIDALAKRARAAGVTVIREPGPGPYGHTVYLADPDGNQVELFEEAATSEVVGTSG